MVKARRSEARIQRRPVDLLRSVPHDFERRRPRRDGPQVIDFRDALAAEEALEEPLGHDRGHTIRRRRKLNGSGVCTARDDVSRLVVAEFPHARGAQELGVLPELVLLRLVNVADESSCKNHVHVLEHRAAHVLDGVDNRPHTPRTVRPRLAVPVGLLHAQHRVQHVLELHVRARVPAPQEAVRHLVGALHQRVLVDFVREEVEGPHQHHPLLRRPSPDLELVIDDDALVTISRVGEQLLQLLQLLGLVMGGALATPDAGAKHRASRIDELANRPSVRFIAVRVHCELELVMSTHEEVCEAVAQLDFVVPCQPAVLRTRGKLHVPDVAQRALVVRVRLRVFRGRIHERVINVKDKNELVIARRNARIGGRLQGPLQAMAMLTWAHCRSSGWVLWA
mmetsp:Transcript_4700/g.13818  ORF Transcript_4700/g.13818 Transcript_4700/m.13818 type:complete len:395 (+) Transcript_4700:894-2078(+)